MSLNRKQSSPSLDEVKGIISALLVARKHKYGVPVTQLDQDYRDEAGTRIPFRRFNFPTLIDFLDSLNETLTVSARSGGYVVNPIVNEKVRHVSTLVAGQKTSGRRPMRGRRFMGRSGSSYSTPSYQAPKRMHSGLLADVVRIVQMNPEGIDIGRVLQYVRDKMMDTNYNAQLLINQLCEVPHEITVDGNILYSSKRWRHDRNAQEKRGNVGYERRDDFRNRDKPASNFTVAPSAQNSSGSGNHVSHSNIRIAGSSASEDDDGFELVSPASEALTAEKFKTMENNSYKQLSSTTDQREKDKNGTDSKRNESKKEEDKIDLNTRDETKNEANPEYNENSSALIKERTRFRLEKLVQNRPKGIWCAELPTLYYKEYGVELNYEELGFYAVSDFASYLPDIFHCVQPQEFGDIKLFDAKAPKPGITQTARPKTLTLANLHNIYEDDADEEGALPMIVPPEICNRLIPDGVMRMGETVAQISVGNITKGVNEFVSVVVVEVFTPSFFWIQLFAKKPKFDTFMTDLHTFYESRGNKYVIPLVVLEKGLNCACKYAEKWHRGIIKHVAPDHTVTVVFYDYGTIKSYPAREIRFLHRSWSRLAAQAIPCGLYNVKPVGSNKWSQSVSYEFVRQVAEIPLVATIAKKDEDNNSMLIGLTNTEGIEDFHINDWLVQSGLAVYGKMGDTVDVNDRCYADLDPVSPQIMDKMRELPKKNGSPSSTDLKWVVEDINRFLLEETSLPIDAITSNGSPSADPEKIWNNFNVELLKAYMELKKKVDSNKKSEQSTTVNTSSAECNLKSSSNDSPHSCNDQTNLLTNGLSDSNVDKEESAILIDLTNAPVSKSPPSINYTGYIGCVASNCSKNLLYADSDDFCDNSLPNSQLPPPLTPISNYTKNEQVSFDSTEDNIFDSLLSQSVSDFPWKEHAGLLYEEPLPMNNDETIESPKIVLSPIAEMPTVAQKICAWRVVDSSLNDSRESQRKIQETTMSERREKFQESVTQSAENFFDRIKATAVKKSTAVSQPVLQETNPFKANFNGVFDEKLSSIPPSLPAKTTLGNVNETNNESSLSFTPRIIYEAEPVLYDSFVTNLKHNVPANDASPIVRKEREEKSISNKIDDTISSSASSSILRADCDEFIPANRIKSTFRVPPGFQAKDRDFNLQNKIIASSSMPPGFPAKVDENNSPNEVKTTSAVPPGLRIEAKEFIATKQYNVESWISQAQSFVAFYANYQGNVETPGNLVTNGQNLVSSVSAKPTNVANSTSLPRNSVPPPLPPRTYLKSKVESKSVEKSERKEIKTTSKLEARLSILAQEAFKNIKSLEDAKKKASSLKNCATSSNENQSKKTNEKSIFAFEEEIENFKIVELSKGPVHLIYLNNEGWITIEEFVEMFTTFENSSLLISILTLKRIAAPVHQLNRSDDPALFKKLDRTWLKVNRDENNRIKNFLQLMRIKSCLTILQKLKIIKAAEVYKAVNERIFPENPVLFDMWTLITAIGSYELQRSKISFH